MNDHVTCRLCALDSATINMHGGIHHVTCPRCGKYEITTEAQEDWEDAYLPNLSERGKANISGWMREHADILLDSDDLDFLRGLKTPSVQYRAERLLVEFAKRTPALGQGVGIPTAGQNAFDLMGVSSSISSAEVVYLVDLYLSQEKGYLQPMGQPFHHAAVLPKGFAYLEELNRNPGISSIGFCAMWFDEEMAGTWENSIRPAIAAAGYEPKRIDGHEHNNRIDDEIISMLRRSKFVVADFTGQRGGVYFEAGFALGNRLPVVWTIREDDLENLHFDNRQYNFIVWQQDRLNEFRDRLRNRIEATIGRGPL